MEKLTKQSKVTLVELPAYQFGELNGKLCYDEYSYFRLPSRAIHTLEAVLREDEWEDVQSINPLLHGEKGKCSYENFESIINSNVLGISSITRTAPQSFQLAKTYKKFNPKGIVIFGGDHTTAMPYEALENGDIVVLREGEVSFRELMNQLVKDRYGLDDVKGIGFNRNGERIFTQERELMIPEELSKMPYPYYDKETKEKVNISVMETTRGCPNKCKFCSVWKNCGGKYRTKTIEYVIKGFKQIQDMKGGVFITDNNFSANPEYLKDLSHAIQNEKINRRSFSAQVDIRGSKDNRIESLLRAGVKFVYVGFESNNNETLEEIGKPFNAKQNEEAARAYNEAGLWVHGMFIIGMKETKESLRELLEFAKKYTHSAQFFPLGPAPGTDIRELMEKQDRILSNKWNLYDGHHVLVRSENSDPKNLSAYELQLGIQDMYEEYYSLRNSLRRLKNSPNKRVSLGLTLYTTIMRGVKKVVESSQTKSHLEFLKRIS